MHLIKFFKNEYCNKIIQIILQILLFSLSIFLINNKKLYIKTQKEIKASHIRKLIIKLKAFTKFRVPKYILFSDFFGSKYCSDINAYTLFEYCLNNNISEAYYIINIESELYQNLEKRNKLKNLIIYNNHEFIYDKLFNFFLHSKVIIQSYVILDFQYIMILFLQN